MYCLLSVAWLEDWEIWVYLNLSVVTRSNSFMLEKKGDPEEQVLYDHDTASAIEILEDYFTGVP